MLFKFVAILLFSLFFPLTLSAQDDAQLYISTGKTLQDVRVRVVSFDENTGNATLRFSGSNCAYCDTDYIVSETARLKTRDYEGDMDIELLKTMTFASGDAQVLLSSRSVRGIYYVNIEE